MKRIVVVAALVTAVLGALAIRVVLEGRTALARGDDAMARTAPLDAVRAYEAAARWYLPLAPHVDTAYDRLRALTASQQPGIELAAWRAIRGAAETTRSLWTPHRHDLEAANAAIARLSARMPASGSALAGETDTGARASAGETDAAREAWHRSRLEREGRASLPAAVLAACGILAWLGGAFALVRRGVSPDGAILRRRALASALAIVVGLVCWSIGLYNA